MVAPEGSTTAVPQMPTPKEYGIDGRPGYRIDFTPTEYVIGQCSETGFRLTWTTEKNVADVMTNFLPVVGSNSVATVGLSGAGLERKTPSELTDLLASPNADEIAYIKLVDQDQPVYVFFRKDDEKDTREVAVMGDNLLSPDDTDNSDRIYVAMMETASPLVREQASEILDIMSPVTGLNREDPEDRLIRLGGSAYVRMSPEARAALSEEFDQMFVKMQTPEARRAIDAVFRADPTTLRGLLSPKENPTEAQ